MKNWKLLVTTAVLLGIQSEAGGRLMVRIYYYPFALETPAGITLGDIEEMARCICDVKPESQVVDELRSIINSAKPIDSRRTLDVRLKVSGLSSEDVFVGDDGAVQKSQSRYKLADRQFKALDELMARTIRTDSCTCR